MKEKAIKLKSGKLSKTKPRHPWIYRRQLLKNIDSSIKAGDVVAVLNSDGIFLGRGYYNPSSNIAARILSFDDKKIDKGFFVERIKNSLRKREPLLSKTNAYRAVFSESDGLPGLFVDVYGETAVFQIFTLGMERFKDMVASSIKEVLGPRYLYEKSVSAFRKIEGMKDLKGWWGDKGDSIVEIREGTAKFLVDIENGHKTGFYLDQRNSRMAMSSISKGKSVLDLCCYTGGFSVSAAIYGAKSVTAVDIKEDWLTLARTNAELNNVDEKMEFTKADVFSFLDRVHESGQKFDIIIIDPPSFAKSRYSIRSALKGYMELNVKAMNALPESGVLATFSCSHNITGELFSGMLKEAARVTGRKIAILKRCRQAPDHPVLESIPETQYLKGYLLKVHY